MLVGLDPVHLTVYTCKVMDLSVTHSEPL